MDKPIIDPINIHDYIRFKVESCILLPNEVEWSIRTSCNKALSIEYKVNSFGNRTLFVKDDDKIILIFGMPFEDNEKMTTNKMIERVFPYLNFNDSKMLG